MTDLPPAELQRRAVAGRAKNRQARSDRSDVLTMQTCAEVVEALDALASGQTKDVIREGLLARLPNPFLRKIVEMAASGFPPHIIAASLGVPDEANRVRQKIERYRNIIAGIQCVYSEVQQAADVLESRHQATRKWIGEMDKFYEILDAENLDVRRKAFVDLWDRTGFPKKLEIDATISNIVQYSMTGDVRAIFEAVRSGEMRVIREGPPEDFIDVDPEDSSGGAPSQPPA